MVSRLLCGLLGIEEIGDHSEIFFYLLGSSSCASVRVVTFGGVCDHTSLMMLTSVLCMTTNI